MTNSPVLFLVFNRFETTKRVFEAIRCAKPARLYVASDGARTTRIGEAEVVQSIRQYITDSIDWECDAKFLFRESNLGCGLGVSSAISWFFEQEEMGIILEDDCLPSESFFPYCDELLHKYKNDQQVMMIAGGNYLFSQIEIEDSYSFCKYQLIWGWATWKRAWDKYDPFMVEWPIYSQSKQYKLRVPKIDERLYWKRIFNKTFAEKLSSTWDYQWLYSIWVNNGCSVFPKENLIQNIGFGEDATHTVDEHLCSGIELGQLDFPLKHPAIVFENADANAIICTKFYMGKRGILYFVSAVKAMLTNFISRG